MYIVRSKYCNKIIYREVNAEAYSEICQRAMPDVWQGFEYASGT